MFNQIMIKNFPKDHKFHKYINSNNTKISYSCTPNMGMIIAGHNKKLLNKYYEELNRNKNPTIVEACDCNVKADCPLNGLCFKKDVLYKAKCSADGEPTREYLGITATTFKKRYGNHKSSFKNKQYSQATTLSSYFWKMKEANKNPKIKFSIVRTIESYTPEAGVCRLCTAEKVEIMRADQRLTLNKKNEIMATCRHRRKFKLSNFIT